MLAVFDVEGTVTENEFWDLFPETIGTSEAAMDGKADFRETMETRFKAIKGISISEFEKKGGEVKMRPGALLAFETLHSNGFETALVSSGFDFFVGHIARELGVKHWTANSIVEQNGTVSGFREPLVDAAAKKKFVKHLQEKSGFTKAETVVVGDGANDLEMMECAGFAIGFNAKQKVRERVNLAVAAEHLKELVEPVIKYGEKIARQARVLVVGKVDTLQMDRTGVNFEVCGNVGKNELINKVKNYDVLVYRGSEAIDTDVLNAGKRLKLVIRPGVGLDHIDLMAAEKKGIMVVNTPTVSTESVAEHTIGLMLALLRKIPAADRSLKDQKWEKNEFCGLSLAGKTVGIIGFGRIGRAVARRLRGFCVKIIAFDPNLHSEDFEDLSVKRKPTLESLLEEADVVTLHVPLTMETTDLINSATFEKMKPGAFLINASRGKVVNETALVNALQTGKLAGASLDVFCKEPLGQNPLLKLENVVLTPHIAGSTAEAMHRIGSEITSAILQFERGMR